MLLELQRFYKNNGILAGIIVNTDYVRTIEDATESSPAGPLVRIVMEGTGDEPHIFYVTDTMNQIKNKIKGRRKK